MAQKVIVIPTGRFDGRNYLLVCEETHEAALIDADMDYKRILTALQAEGAVLRYILLTHGHFDHVSSSDLLREKTGAKTAIHRLEVPALSDPYLNVSGQLDPSELVEGREIDIILDEGSALVLGAIEINVLHTPGHTPGSCCFLAGGDLFTGDTLFRGTYGNTGFPGGNMGDLMRSAARLLSLDASLNVYPGHGNPTTIARERVHNPISI
jgi:glyoxylase-like metal-dependent hydrolase (beta-lactamase superfamily II)